MSLQVLLGAPEGGAKGRIKTSDGKELELYPLRLSDLQRLQAKLGPMAGWDKAEARAKLEDLETILFILWLAVRRNAAAKDWTPEQVGDLFGIEDLDALRQAIEHVFESSGLTKKAAAAGATGPGSGST